MTKNNYYPPNLCVHGNGFIQIDLGGSPETRIHIWNRRLAELTQHVNTQWHDHRFGFVSAVIKGALVQQEMHFVEERDYEVHDQYTQWHAEGERGPNGNRPLVQLMGPSGGDVQLFRLKMDREFPVAAGSTYSMEPAQFHRSVPLTGTVVTLMTKTEVLDKGSYMASVMCPKPFEPDQEFDRFQIPYSELLTGHIGPALRDTPFENSACLRP